MTSLSSYSLADPGEHRSPVPAHLSRMPLLVILAIALATRLYVAAFSGLPWFSTDTQAYFDMADAILAHHPIASFPNGYPLLIAVVKAAAPATWIPALLIGVNVVLSTATVWLVIRIAGIIMASPGAVGMAGAAMALFPNQLNYVRQLMTEVPSTFLLTLSLFLLLKRRWFFSGLTMFCVGLIRSSLLPIVPLLWLVLVFHPAEHRRWRNIMAHCMGLLAGFALYAPLLICDVVKPSHNFGFNVLISIRSPGERFSLEGFSDEERRHPLKTYLTFACAHPGAFARQRLEQFNELWGWPSDANPPRSLSYKLLIALRLPLLLLSVAGLWLRRRDVNIWYVFTPIVAVTVVHVGMFAGPRFTFTAEPSIVLLAIVACAALRMPSRAVSN